MRICIWYELTQKPWGGSNSFLSALSKEFKRMGFKVDSTPKNADQVVLVNSWSRGRGKYLNVDEIRKIKRESLEPRMITADQSQYPSIIQRLDGIARLYGRNDPRADEIQLAIAQLADHVIFQSEYSRQSFLQYGLEPKFSAVIHNAVDGNLFYPSNQQYKPGEILNLVAISWSDNLKKGFSVLPEIAKFPDVRMYFIGNWNPEVEPGEVIRLGIKSRAQIAQVLRSMDILVHPAVNDPCSNVIIEALASGLPVLFNNSGGNPELASAYGVPLEDDPGTAIQEIRQRYVTLRSRMLENRADFLIQKCAEKYQAVFEKCLDR